MVTYFTVAGRPLDQLQALALRLLQAVYEDAYRRKVAPTGNIEEQEHPVAQCGGVGKCIQSSSWMDNQWDNIVNLYEERG